MDAPVDIVDRIRVIEVERDSCDACGAPAHVYAEFTGGRTLAYCGHCGTRFWKRLNEAAIKVIDLRHRIDP